MEFNGIEIKKEDVQEQIKDRDFSVYGYDGIVVVGEKGGIK